MLSLVDWPSVPSSSSSVQPKESALVDFAVLILDPIERDGDRIE